MPSTDVLVLHERFQHCWLIQGHYRDDRKSWSATVVLGISQKWFLGSYFRKSRFVTVITSPLAITHVLYLIAIISFVPIIGDEYGLQSNRLVSLSEFGPLFESLYLVSIQRRMSHMVPTVFEELMIAASWKKSLDSSLEHFRGTCKWAYRSSCQEQSW